MTADKIRSSPSSGLTIWARTGTRRTFKMFGLALRGKLGAEIARLQTEGAKPLPAEPVTA
jgi:hypothetical protein